MLFDIIMGITKELGNLLVLSGIEGSRCHIASMRFQMSTL